MRQSREEHSPQRLNEDENERVSTRMIPLLSAEERAEQLLKEYQKAPNPDLMLYMYESGPASWFCACGRENRNDEAFCGNCGVSRKWLEEHSSDTYLAKQIIAEKGEDAVRTQAFEVPVREPESEEENAQRPEEAEQAARPEARAKTRLDGYGGSGPLLSFYCE